MSAPREPSADNNTSMRSTADIETGVVEQKSVSSESAIDGMAAQMPADSETATSSIAESGRLRLLWR